MAIRPVIARCPRCDSPHPSQKDDPAKSCNHDFHALVPLYPINEPPGSTYFSPAVEVEVVLSRDEMLLIHKALMHMQVPAHDDSPDEVWKLRQSLMDDIERVLISRAWS